MFVLAYKNVENNANKIYINDFKKYFLQRVKIENYNIEINRRNCYDQLINDLIKQYDEVKNVSTERQSDHYTMVVY